MTRGLHTDRRIDDLLALAGLHQQALRVVPLSTETDLMREGVFLSLTNEDFDVEAED